MRITYINDIQNVDKEKLNALYADVYDDYNDVYALFEKSLLYVFAYCDDKLLGAVRVISEGVETALMVDLAADKTTDEKTSYDIKKGLILEIEKSLNNKRVMVYSHRNNLKLLEDLGYGRCKNAWTYFRTGFDEAEFLPSGYRYENEYTPVKEEKVKKENKNVEITYKTGYDTTSFDEINEVLTKAFFNRPHDINKTTKAFINSQYVVTAFDNEKLVGVARAVSDNEKYATILNVAVDPSYQGLSIGKNIVLTLSKIINAEIIVLNTHPGAIGFYNRIKEYRRNKYVFEKHITNEKKTPMPSERSLAMFTPAGFLFPDEYTND